MFVYLIQNLETSKYKIGVSKNPQKRIKQLQTGSGEELKLISVYETENARKIESALHNKFLMYKTNGEWFEFGISEEVDFTKTCKKIDEGIIFLKKSGNIFI